MKVTGVFVWVFVIRVVFAGKPVQTEMSTSQSRSGAGSLDPSVSQRKIAVCINLGSVTG